MTIVLTPEECRVLGVLIEKAQTTPQQYPLTLNGLIAGCNQKNNRDPVVEYGEETVFDALDGLRGKELARQVDMLGSRVDKYRHVARETLAIDTNQLVVLAELLLRGPVTLGELRGRASRMHPIESLDIAKSIVDSLINHTPPLAREIPPAPGSRAERYVHLLCPPLLDEALRAPVATANPSPSRASAGEREERTAALEQAVADLRDRVARLEAILAASSAASSHPPD